MKIQCTDTQLANLRKIDSILERLETIQKMWEYGGWPPQDKDYLHNQWGELCEKLRPIGEWLRSQPADFVWNTDTAPITVRGAETRRRTQETVDGYTRSQSPLAIWRERRQVWKRNTESQQTAKRPASAGTESSR